MEDYSKKGNQSAATILRENVHPEKSNSNRLISVLDSLLNPSKVFDKETADLFYWLISSGDPPDDYFKKLRGYNISPICGLVWNANFFAYRCRDCGISPCMSLCADCFMGGNHEGHDFNMFKSQSGGACDCGDETVMKTSGFCHRHGKENNCSKQKSVSTDLIMLPKIIIPKLVVCLHEKMKRYYDGDREDSLNSEIKIIIGFLDKLSQVEVLREIFCEKIMFPIDVLVDKQHISGSSGNSPEVTSMISCEASNGRKIVRSASTESQSIEMTVSSPGGTGDPYKPVLTEVETIRIGMKEVCKQTFLQYFMEILVRGEFPSELATLLLRLLPNPSYKETFTRLFCRHYTAIGKSLSSTENPEELSNHMVHFSVQLFSNEFLALKMVKEENLLFKMIFVLSKMVGECLDNYSLEVEGNESSIMAINCDHKILSGHCYWPISSDLTNILSHQTVTRIFLETGDCLNRWMHFVNMLTGMNVNHLRLLTHIEYEPRTYYTAFSMEFESVAAVMWEIYRSIVKMNDKTHALKMIEVSAAALKDWYSFVPSKLKKPSFTFHLSLHRYYSLFVSLAVNHFNEDVSKILPPTIVMPAMNYLISTLAALQEIRSGFWILNGHQIKCQAQSYMQSYFCNSMIDLDVFFVQIGFLVLDPEIMLEMFLDRFGIRHWFQFGELNKEMSLSDDDEMMLLSADGFLNTLLMVLTHRVYTGATEENAMRKDIISNLCVADKTHSQLLDVVPTKPGDTHAPGKCFDQVLLSVSHYKPPAVEMSTMQQGSYTPKDNIWEQEFDLNHINLRVYKKSEQQQALKRYSSYVQKKGLSSTSTIWPPLRDLEPVHPAFNGIFRFLKSKTLQQIIIFILHKITKEEHSIPETVIISTVHLVQLMLSQSNGTEDNGRLEQTPQPADNHVLIDLIWQFLNTLKDKEENKKVEKRLRNLLTDVNLSRSSTQQPQQQEGGEQNENDVTFLVADVFYNSFLKPIVQYVHSLFVQGTIVLSSTLKHIRMLLTQLSDKHKNIFMHLVMYWSHCCQRSNWKVEELPFVKKRDDRAFEFVVSLLFDHLHFLFQIHTPLDGFPYDAFQIDLPHDTGLLGNAHVVINNNKYGSLKKIDINYYNDSNDKKTQDVEMKPEINKEETKDVLSSNMDMCFETASRHNTEVNKHDSNLTLYALLVRLKDILTQSSVAAPPRDDVSTNEDKPRAGDGLFYVDRILKTYFNTQKDNKRHQDEVDWSELCPSASTETPLKKKQERRRRASERQKQLLAEFASQQKKFLNSAGKDMEICDDDDFDQSSEHECVICAQMGESTEEKPLGLIVLLQSSTVLGRRKIRHHAPRQTSASNAGDILCEDAVEKRKEALMKMFDCRSVRSAIECGLDCGINIQTCGHYIHVHCQMSYFKSLQDEHQRLLNADKGEYPCPLCRQLSNGVLPLLPNSIRNFKSNDNTKGATFEMRCNEINKFLTLYQQGGLTQFTGRALEFTMLTSSISTMVQSMEELTKDFSEDLSKLYYGTHWKWTDKYFLLLASMRQNLETELTIQQSPKSKKTIKSCLSKLLEVFHFHAQYVSSPLRARWNELCYGMDELHESTMAGRSKSSLTYSGVPLLLVDSRSLFLQFFLTWPQRLTMDEVDHIIQVCFNLTFVQALFRIGVNLEGTEKECWSTQARKETASFSLTNYAGLVWKYTTFLDFKESPSDKGVEITQSVVSPRTVESKVQEYCIPFLRLASFLKSTWKEAMSNKQYSNDVAVSFDFKALVEELHLGGAVPENRLSMTSQSSSEIQCTNCLQWPRDNPHEIISKWCETACQKISKNKIPKGILASVVEWQQPKLIELPRLYDSLFRDYRKRTCARCDTVPHDPTICLVCGAFLCFHSTCCLNANNVSECVQHSIDCGCGTGVFLVISSSVSIVIRETRVSLWGSVYLDSFGEEDRDLKRGKPLYLSKERYERLEEEWRKHMLDRSSRRWGLHINRL